MSAMTSTTSMTAIDYAALAERLEAHAECHANVEPFDDEQRQWADDLRTVVTLLEEMADAKPVGMFIKFGKPGDESYDLASRKYWGDPDLVPLYLHPAPQPQPIDPHMVAAEDRYPDEPTEVMAAAACHPENIAALLADHAEREAALRAEVERLKAAIDMQPSPPTREDMDWAGKVHLAEAEKENDALRAEVEALRADAERFRWLCDQELPDWMDLYHQHPYRLRERIDAALAQAKDAEARG